MRALAEIPRRPAHLHWCCALRLHGESRLSVPPLRPSSQREVARRGWLDGTALAAAA